MTCYFMVGTESLNINDIVLIESRVGSGLVPNYDSLTDAINALILKTNEFIQRDIARQIKESTCSVTHLK